MNKLFLLTFVIGLLIFTIFGCATMDAEAYKNRGNQFFEQKNFDKALTEYNKALKLDPNYPNAIFNIGTVYVNQGKYDLALEQYNKAIAIGSENNNVTSVMYEYRSRLYYVVYKKYDQALQDCEYSIKINPDNTSAKNFFQTMNLRRFNSVNAAVNAFVKEFPSQSSRGGSNNLWENFMGYNVNDDGKGHIVVYIEQPDVEEEVEKPQDSNRVRHQFPSLSEVRIRLSPDIPQIFEINESLADCYFKFSDNSGIEITKTFYEAYLEYLNSIIPSSSRKQVITERAKLQEKERIQEENNRNRPKYTRIFEVLESDVPSQNYKTWIINTRNQMVNEILRSNSTDSVIDSYYRYAFTGDGRVLSRDLLYQMTISALGGDRYNRIINTAVQYLSMDGYYDTNSYQVAAQMIGILIIKELCKIKLDS
jgi:tetratricopeptide (TPR) repeat protein